MYIPFGRSRRDRQVNAEVTRGRQGAHVEALCAVAGAGRVLRIVVREIGPGEQVRSDERDVRVRDTEALDVLRGDVVAEANFAQLDEARVVQAGFRNRIDVVVVVFRRHRLGVRLAGPRGARGLVKTLD